MGTRLSGVYGFVGSHLLERQRGGSCWYGPILNRGVLGIGCGTYRRNKSQLVQTFYRGKRAKIRCQYRQRKGERDRRWKLTYSWWWFRSRKASSLPLSPPTIKLCNVQACGLEASDHAEQVVRRNKTLQLTEEGSPHVDNSLLPPRRRIRAPNAHNQPKTKCQRFEWCTRQLRETTA